MSTTATNSTPRQGWSKIALLAFLGLIFVPLVQGPGGLCGQAPCQLGPRDVDYAPHLLMPPDNFTIVVSKDAPANMGGVMVGTLVRLPNGCAGLSYSDKDGQKSTVIVWPKGTEMELRATGVWVARPAKLIAEVGRHITVQGGWGTYPASAEPRHCAPAGGPVWFAAKPPLRGAWTSWWRN